MNPEQQAGGFPAFSGKIDDVVAYKRNVDAQFIGRIFNEGFLTHNNLISGREDVLVFPNPSSGNFNIKGNNISDVQIFNALGHEVSKAFRIRNGSGSVSIENGNAAIGTYFVHFLSDKYKKTKVIQIN
jgi:hypothetical protein